MNSPFILPLPLNQGPWRYVHINLTVLNALWSRKFVDCQISQTHFDELPCFKFKIYSLLFLNWPDQLNSHFSFKLSWVKSQTPPDTCRNVAYLTTPSILWMKSNPYFSNLKSEYLIFIEKDIFLILCFSLKFLTRTSYFPFPLYCILFFNLKGSLLFIHNF